MPELCDGLGALQAVARCWAQTSPCVSLSPPRDQLEPVLQRRHLVLLPGQLLLLVGVSGLVFRGAAGPPLYSLARAGPGRAHKGSASSSVSARPPRHHIPHSAGSLSPAPCPAAEPSTFLCARGTTEGLTVPLCSALAPARPRRAYIAPVPGPAPAPGSSTRLQQRHGWAWRTSPVPHGWPEKEPHSCPMPTAGGRSPARCWHQAGQSWGLLPAPPVWTPGFWHRESSALGAAPAGSPAWLCMNPALGQPVCFLTSPLNATDLALNFPLYRPAPECSAPRMPGCQTSLLQNASRVVPEVFPLEMCDQSRRFLNISVPKNSLLL